MIIGQEHTGLCVSNLDKSIAFYRDVLGLTMIKREEPKATRARKLGVPGAVIQIAVFEYGENNQYQLELIEYLEPKAPNAYGEPVNSIGQTHIAFKVDDLEKEIARISALGVEFVGGNDCEVNAEGPLKGWKWIYFKDPDGTNLELIEGNLQKD